MIPSFEGKRALYNFPLHKIMVPKDGSTQFVLPDNLGRDYYNLTVVYGVNGNIAPIAGHIVVVREDVDKTGDTRESVEAFQDWNPLNFAFTTLGQNNVSLKLSNVTPNRFTIKNKLGIDIDVYVFIDVLTQPITKGI